MFTIYNKPSHQFKNKIFYKIEDVMKVYQKFRDFKSGNIKKFPQGQLYKRIKFLKPNKYMNWLLNYYNIHHEFRCEICGCKANHFRLMKDDTFHLFGIKHEAKHDGIYLFFNRDHIIPASMNGSLNDCNIRLTCERCNTIRGNDISEIDPKLFKKNRLLKFQYTLVNILGMSRKALRANSNVSQSDKHIINNLIKYLGKADQKFLNDLWNKLEKV